MGKNKMQALDLQWLLAIGIFLIGFEAFIFSFFTFPIGIGYIIIGLVHKFYFPFESFIVQSAFALSIGFVLILMLRKSFLAMIHKSQDTQEEKIHKEGIGIIDDTQIRFEGTYWNTNDDLSSYSNGDKVNILIQNNMAKII